MQYFLGLVPQALEDAFFDKFREIERNYREHRWEPAELNGGKLSEVAYCILRGYVDDNFPVQPSKPANFYSACNDLANAPVSFGRSVRIQIPRMLIALYEIRNNRNVGHIGGDVDPNLMDAVCVLHMAKWVASEFVRLFHRITLTEATAIVEAISDREVSLIWDTGRVRRVLDNSLTMLEKTLLLLYAAAGPMNETELLTCVEHSNPSVYRRDVLRKAHKNRLIEYSQADHLVTISPLGVTQVETIIFLKAKI
jgi:hypothetical protein